MPDEDVRDFDTDRVRRRPQPSACARSWATRTVEPDGSVRVKVPANVRFAITVLDANGRRIGPRHDNWLQVQRRRGAQVQRLPRRRRAASRTGASDLFDAVNAGATTTGQPFPNTNPAFFADFGETMAQARARISCQTDCAALTPSVDVVFDDVWTDAVAAGRAADPSFAYRYADLTDAGTDEPRLHDQLARGLPRSTIHYEQHIHPLVEQARGR